MACPTWPLWQPLLAIIFVLSQGVRGALRPTSPSPSPFLDRKTSPHTLSARKRAEHGSEEDLADPRVAQVPASRCRQSPGDFVVSAEHARAARLFNTYIPKTRSADRCPSSTPTTQAVPLVFSLLTHQSLPGPAQVGLDTMYLHLPILLFLLAHVVPSDANVFARGSESFMRAASLAHRQAARRSAGLARDLRLSFRGLLAEQEPSQPAANSRVYCVNSQGLAGNGTTGSTGGKGTSPVVSGPTSSHTGKGATSTSSGSSPGATSTSPPSSSPWKLKQQYQGNSFFNGWDFFTGADPTNGIVTYIDQNTAQSANLIEINSAGNAVMRVETTPQVANTRQSVRITTQFTYTGALVIMDSVHMPTGCGTWPAFWSNGPNWPAGGEIDIVEGVNDYTNNQATIHTNPGCTVSSSSSATLGITGSLVGGTNCAAAQTGNQGCGVRAAQTNSFGAAFNSADGGVYAMQWDNDGVSVFFFPRSAIPSDITANAPQPQNWGQPMAFWPSAGCDPFTFFSDHSAIFDTTLCGDWASGVWTSTGIPGQDQSCAQRTGVATCEQFVRNNGTSLDSAYWEVKYVQIYQTS